MEQRLIDANALREEISSLSITVTGIRAGKDILRDVLLEYRKTVLRIIEEQPTIEAEPVKHGRWVYKPYENDEAVWLYYCSECNAVSASAWNYCRECGAKMEVDNG